MSGLGFKLGLPGYILPVRSRLLSTDQRQVVHVQKMSQTCPKRIGYWLLVIGYWLWVIGYWLLVMGYWLLVVGYGLWVRVYVPVKMLNAWVTEIFTCLG